MKVFYKLTLAIILIFSINNSHALSPEEKLCDQSQENRAMNLFLQVRCLVCNGQVIENSDTKFSHDMRELIRNEIRSGKSDEEIKEQLIKTFGSDILTSPNSHFVLSFLLASLAISAVICYSIFLKKPSKI